MKHYAIMALIAALVVIGIFKIPQARKFVTGA